MVVVVVAILVIVMVKRLGGESEGRGVESFFALISMLSYSAGYGNGDADGSPTTICKDGQLNTTINTLA